MRIFFLVILILISINSILLSQEDEEKIKKEFPVIEVEASDSKTLLEPNVLFNLSKVSSAASTTDIIKQSNLFYIKDYDGNSGGFKTISLHGSTSSQVSIMIEGIPINSTGSGSLDLNSIPSYLFNEIEVYKTGSTAYFGGNALAGGVNFISKFLDDDSSFLKYSGNIGIFNKTNMFDGLINMNLKLRVKEFQLRCGLIESNSFGNFKFNINSNNKIESKSRTNNDIKREKYFFSLEYYNPEFFVKNILFYDESYRGLPGAVVDGHIENTASRLDEFNFTDLFISNFKIFDDKEIKSSFLFRNSNLNFKDTILKQFQKSSEFDFTWNNSTDLVIFKNFQSIITQGLTYNLLYGNIFDKNTGNIVDRTSLYASVQLKKEIKVNKEFNIILDGALRTDILSKIDNPENSYFSGIRFDFNKIPLFFNFQYSSNFRLPSFNEMYYFNYGNPDLKPERANSFNFNISSSIFKFLEFNIDLFDRNIENQIVSVPKNTIAWEARNYAKVNTLGLDLDFTANILKDVLLLKFNYSYLESKDKDPNSLNFNKFIPYVPREMLNTSLFFYYKNVGLVSNYNFTGYRYFLPDNNISSIMNSYGVLDLEISYRFLNIKSNESIFIGNIKIYFICSNIFDTQYELVRNYPVRGRNFKFGFDMDLNTLKKDIFTNL